LLGQRALIPDTLVLFEAEKRSAEPLVEEVSSRTDIVSTVEDKIASNE
jgi:hypothetical protein